MSSERKVRTTDKALIRRELDKHLQKLSSRRNTKAWVKYIDLDRGVSHIIYSAENAWIVGDAYLVVYNIAAPWFIKEGVEFLNEELVLALVPGGNFSDVSDFLQRKAKEAGAKLAQVGTALSTSDKVLASLYQSQGFHQEAVSLVKEV